MSIDQKILASKNLSHAVIWNANFSNANHRVNSIGSGSVESVVKQVDRRTKISGAQWKRENVPQVLAHRCAYLNGLLSV